MAAAYGITTEPSVGPTTMSGVEIGNVVWVWEPSRWSGPRPAIVTGVHPEHRTLDATVFGRRAEDTFEEWVLDHVPWYHRGSGCHLDERDALCNQGQPWATPKSFIPSRETERERVEARNRSRPKPAKGAKPIPVRQAVKRAKTRRSPPPSPESPPPLSVVGDLEDG